MLKLRMVPKRVVVWPVQKEMYACVFSTLSISRMVTNQNCLLGRDSGIFTGLEHTMRIRFGKHIFSVNNNLEF